MVIQKFTKLQGDILHRDSLTNANVKKYYSDSIDLKIFWWDLKINHALSLNIYLNKNKPHKFLSKS